MKDSENENKKKYKFRKHDGCGAQSGSFAVDGLPGAQPPSGDQRFHKGAGAECLAGAGVQVGFRKTDFRKCSGKNGAGSCHVPSAGADGAFCA